MVACEPAHSRTQILHFRVQGPGLWTEQVLGVSRWNGRNGDLLWSLFLASFPLETQASRNAGPGTLGLPINLIKSPQNSVCKLTIPARRPPRSPTSPHVHYYEYSHFFLNQLAPLVAEQKVTVIAIKTHGKTPTGLDSKLKAVFRVVSRPLDIPAVTEKIHSCVRACLARPSWIWSLSSTANDPVHRRPPSVAWAATQA